MIDDFEPDDTFLGIDDKPHRRFMRQGRVDDEGYICKTCAREPCTGKHKCTDYRKNTLFLNDEDCTNWTPKGDSQ